MHLMGVKGEFVVLCMRGGRGNIKLTYISVVDDNVGYILLPI
jgi:hypothetical protein